MTNATGEVTFAARYTPWGGTLETYGTGNFEFGYFGGMMDEATGLIYIGNGNYYDPSTGRFLNRDAKPNNSNPYIPFDPMGALFAPLGLLAMFYSRKKKSSKWGMWIALLLVVGSVGMGLSACQFTAPGYDVTATLSPTQPNTYTVTATPTTVPSSTPSPTDTPLPTIIAICTLTLTPISIDAELEPYGVKFDGDLAQWTVSRKEAVKEAVKAVNEKLAGTVVGATFKAIYGYVNMTWGLKNATGTCDTIKVGACASSRHQINFATISDDPLRARNNVVHELGHAFSSFWSNSQLDADRAHPENTHPGIVLGWTQGTYPAYTEYIIAGFPNRPDPNQELGDYYGFYSQQNQLTWQVAVTLAGDPSEEFADQFLGWTFNTWQTPDGIHNHGTLRREWMDKYMPGWINRILRG